MSISDGFIETNSCSVVLTHLSLKFLAVSYYFENKKQIARTCSFGNLENTKDNTDGVGIRFFYLL